MPLSRDNRRNWSCCERPGNSTKSGNNKTQMRKASATKFSKSAAAHKSNNKNTTELLNSDFFEFLSNAFLNLNKSFQTLPEFRNAVPGHERLGNVITATAERLRDNYPYFHPLYAGQMLKPPPPVAQLAY